MTEDDSSSTHPPLPPTTEDDRFLRLRLLRSRRVGPATYRRLLLEHGSAAAALRALPDVAAQAGITDYRPCPDGVIHGELKAGRSKGARLIFEGEADWPADLTQIDNAPVMLWCIGNLSLLGRPMVALVGARNASSLGTRMATKLAQDLGAAGFAIVSGLARGVDTAAHHASLNTGTVAVMPGGVDVLYPAENATLAHDIAKSGLRVSDQPMGLHPQARHFVARNRIISGLARAMVVVEAAAKSGSLTAARHALDQGRDVLAVPGHPFESRSAGCNMLIRDGATLVRGASDILELIGPAQPELPLADPTPAPPPDRPSLRNQHLAHTDILNSLSDVPIAEDQLIRALGAPPTAIAPLLVDLELEGKVIRQAGGLLARAC